MKIRHALGALFLFAAGCTCNQEDEASQAEADVATAMREIEGTVLDADSANVLPPLVLDGAEVPTVDVGKGVQVLQIAPVGRDRSALQAAVVFDRPMVALNDLDSMNQSAALECTPQVDGKRRWAGTSTAVFLPGAGAFPRGTAYRCAVAAGTSAIDGSVLEKELSWTFETPRPRVAEGWPRDGQDNVDLTEPVRLTFDQPVEVAAVQPHVKVMAAGRSLPFEIGRPGSADTNAQEASRSVVEIMFAREPDTAYSIRVAPGIVGVEGPLPSTEGWIASFSTYPPLRVELEGPGEGDAVSPSAWLRFMFSTPVSQEVASEHVKLDPQPEHWSPPEGDWESRWWSYSPVLEPRTDYTLRVDAKLVDIYGQTLTGPAEWTFTTGDYDPWLFVPTGFKLVSANNPPALPYKHLNAERVDIRIARMDPAVLGVPGDWYEAVDRVLGGSAQQRVGPGVEVANRSRLADTPLGGLLGKTGLGWIATRFSAPNVVDYDGDPRLYRGLMVVTDMGATMKVGPGVTDVWVTSLATGEPLPGVDVRVFSARRQVGAATSDASGLARVTGAPTGKWSRWSEELWALLRKGNDASLVRLEWSDGMSPYNFDIWGGFEATGRSVASHGFTDRGVYRPGDPLHARATFRFKTARGLEVPAGDVSWSLDDPRGEAIASGTGTLDRRGGFAVSTQIPEDGELGDYTLKVAAEGEGWSATEWLYAMARAYRPPAFRVVVSGPEAAAIAGDPVKVVADARYLFGAPLAKGEVRWAGWTEPRDFQPAGWDGWSFGPAIEWWNDEEDGCRSGLLGDTVAALATGRSTWSQTVEPGTCDGPVSLMVEATVEDVDRQVIANRTEVLVHPGSFYVGARSTERLPRAGAPTTVEVAAVGLDGTPRSGAAMSVTVSRRSWDSVRERGMDGQWRWVTTTTDDPVHQTEVTSGRTAQTIRFTPKKPGYYVIDVEGKDEAGRLLKGHDSVYVVGDGYVSWGRTDDNRLELVADKTEYVPGDVAEILVKSPFEDLKALVTVEREGVLTRDVITLRGTAHAIRVPIEAAYQPNVFVSVVAVQGAGPQDAPDKGRPQVYMGMTELSIGAEDQHLAVSVSSEAELYRPRDTVSVSVLVKRNGAPAANAGVTLFAVDEAILSLTDYQTPDPHAVMYSHRPLSVLTADGRVAALDRAPFLTKGAARGGGGGEGGDSGPETRTKFLTTITWQPNLTTDASGVVKATFPLPDNLTTFRIMAVADAGATGFGSGSTEIPVSRPLMVRPALPRHLRVGDQAFAGVVVHNDTPRDRQVEVRAEYSGPVEVGGSPAVLRVPANTSVEVPFTLRGTAAGTASFTFSAQSGSDRDALEWSIPVGRDVLLERTATAGTVESGGSISEQIARPDNALPSTGGLTVDLSTTALLGAGTALEYLLDYPHGCIEQKTSKALASLMALAVLDRTGTQLSEDALHHNVEGVLGDLSRFRAASGGFAYWPGGDRPSPMGTAYAVEFMGRARGRGYAVDEPLLSWGVDYLRSYVARTPRASERVLTLAEQAVIAGALAHAGQGDAGLNSRVYASRRDLSVYAVASLLQAIVRTTGQDRRARELERIIASRTTIEAGSASVKENAGNVWRRMWASDDLSTAAALEALLTSDPQHVLTPKLALHLASSRRTGHWSNTRATAGALAALATYAEVREGSGDPITAQLTLAGQSMLSEKVALPGSSFLEVPLADLQNGPLTVSADGGLLYYMARLTYAPRTPQPRDEGFTITRAFDLMAGDGGSQQVTSGSTVRVTLTVVTPVVRHDVAVVDRIPAGLEPLDTSFATTGRAPVEPPGRSAGTLELPDYGGSWVFDHHEIDDAQVRLYADYMPPGVHVFRYVARATTPGSFDHPPATVEEMYEPENFGRTSGGRFVVGAPSEAK